MADFLMPSLGADMDAGTVVDWLVKPGDRVKRGDIVAVVDTQKAAIEVEIFADGIIDQILVPVGAKVPVGTPLAALHGEGEPAPTGAEHVATPAPPPPVAGGRQAVPPPARSSAGPAGPAAHRRISPLARRTAEKLGIDLAAVAGTGPQGSVTQADVERAAASGPPLATAAQATPAGVQPHAIAGPDLAARQRAMRDAIGALMARSKREIPHYYLGAHVDVGRATDWLMDENLKRSMSERLLFSVLVMKAVALAIREVPEMNGFWVDGHFQPAGGVHLGVAISLRQGGLVAPAVHDADKMTLDQLMRSLRDLVARTRAGVLRSSEMSDPTITLTNLGEQGVETVYGVIYPPQVALVGVGKVAERPWAANGMVGARPVMHVTLAADHRASDGHRGGLFLAAIERLLQEPAQL